MRLVAVRRITLPIVALTAVACMSCGSTPISGSRTATPLPTPTTTPTISPTPPTLQNGISAKFSGALNGYLQNPRWATSNISDGPGCLANGEGDSSNAVSFAGSLDGHSRVWVIVRLDGTTDGTFSLHPPVGSPSPEYLDARIATTDDYFWTSVSGTVTLSQNRQSGSLSATLQPEMPSYASTNHASGAVNLEVTYQCP